MDASNARDARAAGGCFGPIGRSAASGTRPGPGTPPFLHGHRVFKKSVEIKFLGQFAPFPIISYEILNFIAQRSDFLFFTLFPRF